MGQSTKPVQPWETLKLVGIAIKRDGEGINVSMTINGAAQLVRSLHHWKRGNGKDPELTELFLKELIHQGRSARLMMKR